jgi:hypothetical protein
MELTKAPSTEMFKMVQTGLGMFSAGARIRVRARHCAARKGESPEQETDATAVEGSQCYQIRVEVFVEISPGQGVCHSVVPTLDVPSLLLLSHSMALWPAGRFKRRMIPRSCRQIDLHSKSLDKTPCNLEKFLRHRIIHLSSPD